MTHALMMLLCTASAAPGTSDLPAPPPRVDVSSDPGPGASPLVEQLPVPSVVGSATELDLERLARVRTTYTVSVDLSVISRVDAAAAPAIARHAAADPRWRVIEEDGVLLAVHRESQGRERVASYHGYHERPRDIWRVALRFAPWPEGSPWADSTFVSPVDGSATSLQMNTFVLGDEPFKGYKATAVAIDGPHLGVDLYEAGAGKGRTHTADGISVVLPFLEGIIKDPSRIEQHGYHRWYMPAGEPLRERREVELTSPGRGLLELRARVNPGRPGWTWARLLDEDLQPWEEQAVGRGTRERTGYSALPEEQFYLQSTFPVPRGRKTSATLELWFQPDEGGPAERLEATPITVPRR